MSYEANPEKFPIAKLTEPQQRFLAQFKSGKPVYVFPGHDTKVANGLTRARLIKLSGDVATLTEDGAAALAAFDASSAAGKETV